MAKQLLNWKEFIHKSPDVYVGVCETSPTEVWLLSESKYVQTKIDWNPGFYNCINELIYNALDQKWRGTKTYPLTYITITYTSSTGELVIENDGVPMEVTERVFEFVNPETGVKENKCLKPPQVFFGYFHSGTNYDKRDQACKTSGKNGMGAKIVNVLSTNFSVEVYDGKLYFTQSYADHCRITNPPVVEKITAKSTISNEQGLISQRKPFVRVKARLDKNFFKYKPGGEIIAYLARMATEISYIGSIPVTVNNRVYEPRNLRDYLIAYNIDIEVLRSLMFHNKLIKVYMIEVNSKEYTGPVSISFVNGAWQANEGSDVKAARKAINKMIIEFVNTKLKLTGTKIKLTGKDIQKFVLFTELTDENAVFDHQSKRVLTNAYTFNDFKLTEKHKQTLQSCEFYIHLIDTLTGKTKCDIDNFDDANFAGSARASECKLFITEGESAKGFAVEGISYMDGKRDFNGVFPVKGKFLNVTKASVAKQLQNKELQSLNKILNISSSYDYSLPEHRRTLRYGTVILLTDSDDDGIHITSLLLNYIYSINKTLYPLKFVWKMNTPIIRVYLSSTKYNNYYTQSAYEIEEHSSKSKVKYYKGLGSHAENTETRDCFTEFKNNIFELTDKCEKHFDINFSRGKEDERKDAIREYLAERGDSREELPITGHITCTDFLTTNLNGIYQVNVLARHIPNFVDGLKDSYRKIVYTVLMSSTKKEFNIERLAGNVGQVTHYHHGAVSLQECINGMAQSHVGSNNVPFFKALGRVGTRDGNDAAASRYVAVKMNPFYEHFYFIESILKYKRDEETDVEPEEFYPPLPYYLLNGTLGLAPGFKSEIFPYKLEDLCTIVQQLISGRHVDTIEEPTPYFNGFTGKVILAKDKRSFSTHGTMSIVDTNKYRVTEIPAKCTIGKFKETLNILIKTKEISNLVNHSTNHIVDVTFVSRLDIGTLIKKLRLIEKHSLSGFIVLKKNVPTVYTGVVPLLKDFVTDYLLVLQRRKDDQLLELNNISTTLLNKIRFIEYVRDHKINLRTETSAIVKMLETEQFDKMDGTYNYLLHIKVGNLFNDTLNKLKAQLNQCHNNMEHTKLKTPQVMYTELIDTLLSV